MTIRTLVKLKYRSLRACSEASGIPYATLYDICSGATPIGECSCNTVLKLANALDTTVEDLVSEGGFPAFRSNLHHQLRSMGDIPFLLEVLHSDQIRRLHNSRQRLYSIYLTCLIDHICNSHDLPLCEDYEDIRSERLSKPFYVGDSMLGSSSRTSELAERARQNAIPEFLRNNIIEGDLYDAV